MNTPSLNPNKCIAILIGVSKYEDWEPIRPATNNVEALAEVLLDPDIFGIPEQNIKMVKEGTSSQIKQQFITLTKDAKANGIETLLFYYAGHGYRRTDRKFFLAANDTLKDLVNEDGSTGIAYDFIKSRIRKSGIPQSIVLVDACYSGLATMGNKGSLQTSNLPGSYTIASSGGDQVSYFDSDQLYTLFTGELLRILNTGIEDAGAFVTLEQLYLELKASVENRNPAMKPQQSTSREIVAGQYFLCKNGRFDSKKQLRLRVGNLIKEGEGHLDKFNFKEAKFAFLEAKHLAEGLPDKEGLISEIGGKLAELQRAEEIARRYEESKRVKKPKNRKANWQYRRWNKAQLSKYLKPGLMIVGLVLLVFTIWKLIPNNSVGQDPKLQAILTQIQQNMVPVPGGKFMMGCTDEQNNCGDDEKLTHQVTIPEFKMGKYEVTLEEWKLIMGKNPPELYFEDCLNCPVVAVSWNDVKEFLKKLNELTDNKFNYRLPSESEWEYAARGGQNSKYLYSGGNTLDKVGWYYENGRSRTHAVGDMDPNKLGIHDMSGNVWEWCEDHYHGSYEGAPTDGKAWVDKGVNRVLRGGGWNDPAHYCRVAYRSNLRPDGRSSNVGFRLAHSL